eukprot:jgi/Bigna1/90709/estExt_fgenesh1_pg.C_770040
MAIGHMSSCRSILFLLEDLILQFCHINCEIFNLKRIMNKETLLSDIKYIEIILDAKAKDLAHKKVQNASLTRQLHAMQTLQKLCNQTLQLQIVDLKKALCSAKTDYQKKLVSLEDEIRNLKKEIQGVRKRKTSISAHKTDEKVSPNDKFEGEDNISKFEDKQKRIKSQFVLPHEKGNITKSADNARE